MQLLSLVSIRVASVKNEGASIFLRTKSVPDQPLLQDHTFIYSTRWQHWWYRRLKYCNGKNIQDNGRRNLSVEWLESESRKMNTEKKWDPDNALLCNTSASFLSAVRFYFAIIFKCLIFWWCFCAPVDFLPHFHNF